MSVAVLDFEDWGMQLTTKATNGYRNKKNMCVSDGITYAVIE